MKPDISDPTLNRAYAELERHYGFLADPATADRARRGTAYRLVRRISEMGGEEVVVRDRRFTGRAAEV